MTTTYLKRPVARTIIALALSVATVYGAPEIVPDVRTKLARNDIAGAVADIQTYRKSYGVTADLLVAMS